MLTHRKVILDPILKETESLHEEEEKKPNIPLPPLRAHAPISSIESTSPNQSKKYTPNKSVSLNDIINNPLERNAPSTPSFSSTHKILKTPSGKSILQLFPTANADSSFISCTNSYFPSRKAILEQWHLPFGMIIQPFADSLKDSVYFKILYCFF